MVKQLKEGKIMEKKSRLREAFSWILYIILIVVMTYVITTFVGQRTRVEGRSMENTLFDGDNLIVDKISYRFKEPERFDVIIFPYRYEKNVYYIKRIIGMPGETIQIKDGFVYIDGEKLEENFGKEKMDDPGIAENLIELGQDEYFVLGDNRNHSKDSRSEQVGVLHREELAGRAWIRIWPFHSFGVIKHGK